MCAILLTAYSRQATCTGMPVLQEGSTNYCLCGLQPTYQGMEGMEGVDGGQGKEGWGEGGVGGEGKGGYRERILQ